MILTKHFTNYITKLYPAPQGLFSHFNMSIVSLYYMEEDTKTYRKYENYISVYTTKSNQMISMIKN